MPYTTQRRLGGIDTCCCFQAFTMQYNQHYSRSSELGAASNDSLAASHLVYICTSTLQCKLKQTISCLHMPPVALLQQATPTAIDQSRRQGRALPLGIPCCCCCCQPHSKRLLQVLLPAPQTVQSITCQVLRCGAVAAVPASTCLLPAFGQTLLLLLLLPAQPRNSSWPTVGRGLVNSMPATMMAGMKP